MKKPTGEYKEEYGWSAFCLGKKLNKCAPYDPDWGQLYYKVKISYNVVWFETGNLKRWYLQPP